MEIPEVIMSVTSIQSHKGHTMAHEQPNTNKTKISISRCHRAEIKHFSVSGRIVYMLKPDDGCQSRYGTRNVYLQVTRLVAE